MDGSVYGNHSDTADTMGWKENKAADQLRNWWIERQLAPTAIKLGVWNLTESAGRQGCGG